MTDGTIIPYLRYHDAPAALRWLAAAFGFEAQDVHAGTDGSVVHAVMRFGAGRIMLSSVRPGPLGLKTVRETGGATQGIYVYMKEVDAHYARAKAAGAEILYDLQDTDYGSREYSARDLEGNVWSFGTYSAGG